ncbi:MAG: zinc ribbon domain-containing protein [Candidatus Methanomethylophilus sp.]|nr:zinc ribbon domain-containing protein [Methanomethylophilus sp.]
MNEERENYCKLLGLNPFKMKEYSDEDISRRIQTMEERWTHEMNTASVSKAKKYELTQYLRMLPDIRSTMDSTVLKEEEFENARKYLERKASKVRRDSIILHDGGIIIPVPSADKLADKLKWEDVDGRAIITASGIKMVNPPRAVNMNLHTAFRMMNDLGCYTPYEFINDLISYPELNLSVNRVSEENSRDDVRIIYETVAKKLNNVKMGRIPVLEAYTQAIRAVKTALSTDDKFDELVMYGKCQKALQPAFEQMDEDSGTQFTRAYIDNLLATYVNAEEVDYELCIRILEEYCYKRLYPANFSSEESGLVTCPRCKSLINIGPDSQFCPSCGSAINAICPACGTAQTAANHNCVNCGIELSASLSKAKGYEESISKLINAGMTDRALDELSALENTYPQYAAIPALKSKIHECHDRICTLVERISYDFSSFNYYDLKKAAEEGRIDFPALMEREDVKLRYDEACKKVGEADALCVRAADSDGEEAMELYIGASEICPDHPDAVNMLRRYPPEGPGEAEIQTNVDVIEMRFEIPEERRGMTFCIYRNEGSYPEVDQYTKPLAEIDGWTFSDKTVEPGVEYYYKIYSKRWGILSEECSRCGPAIVLCEVTNVDIENTDNGFKLTYQLPRGADRVRIWRKEAGLAAGVGDEDELFHDNNGVVYDENLEGGMTYTYLFVSEYDINGTTERSCGSIFSATTAALPQPISDLEVRWDRKQGNYIATWTGPANATLYYSGRKLDVGVNHMSVRDISAAMTRIEPLDTDDEAYRFDLPESTVIYVYPTITSGSTAVIGKEFVIANLRPFSNLSKSVEGSTCRLSMAWPDDAEFAVLEIDGKDSRGGDRHEEIEVNRDDYMNEGFVEIPLGGASNTSVTVCAVYMIEGEPRKSIGLTTQIYSGEYCRVTYVVDTESVKGDRKKTRVVIYFTCPDESALPRCVMVRSEEGIPLREKDGTVVWESDDPIILSNGRAECFFVTDKDDLDLSRMRLFFPDKRNYNKFRFVHPIYNRRK